MTQTHLWSIPVKQCMADKTVQISSQCALTDVVDIQKAHFAAHTSVDQNCQVYILAI